MVLHKTIIKYKVYLTEYLLPIVLSNQTICCYMSFISCKIHVGSSEFCIHFEIEFLRTTSLERFLRVYIENRNECALNQTFKDEMVTT